MAGDGGTLPSQGRSRMLSRGEDEARRLSERAFDGLCATTTIAKASDGGKASDDHFALMTQLEIMFTQAFYLSRTRWEEHMTCTMDASHTIVRLNYWCRKVAASTATASTATATATTAAAGGGGGGARSYPQQSVSALPMSRTTSESMPHHCIDIALESTDGKGSAGHRSATRKDAMPSTRIAVRCNAVHLDAHQLVVDATSVNVERLLLAVVKQHAFDVATSLREQLLQPSTQPDAFIPDEIGAIVLPTDDYSTEQAKLKEVEGSINREPASMADALLRFRRELLLVDLESMARRIGLLPVRQLFLRPQDWSRFGEGFSCVSFFRLPKLSDAYIVSGVKQGRLHLWLITAGPEDEHCMRPLSYMTAIHFDRLQEKHGSKGAIEQEAENAHASSSSTSSGLIAFATFTKMVAYCQMRILYLKIEQQLVQLGIRYRWSPTSTPSTGGQSSGMDTSSMACIVIRPEDIPIKHREYAYGAFDGVRILVTPVSNSDTDINATTITMANKQIYHIDFQSDIQWTPSFDWSRAARHDGLYVEENTLHIVCTEVASCMAMFLSHWQRVVHMSHLGRQLASTAWRRQYGVEVVRFDFRQLVLEMRKKTDQ
ncbi:hypothetical protein SYNPS1DRAFT_30627 [Syncephalis pseudoplumigaleata]|uniref:Uncharacterized protein n=1 Tax=Syncephalis pseudoplumigaleata TaxID=1712513 RepID=A0A4P9YUT7_9FUNG|nr:hypothetical protein SYNPS1DRAFT_30627 [Syncephalis pseudoplumigaleata]|eukprot:RKP23614.1 hypothetical protein SYNPS1DRAFT_30627 [Syncephalis pseudoplumigaleata]